MSFEWPMPAPAPERHPDLPDIPDERFIVTFVRAGGAGGQKVNKTSSKAFARLKLDEFFSPEQQQAIRSRYAKQVNDEGFLWADCDTQRSQSQNKAEVIARMRRWIEIALTPEIERKPTKPTYGSKMRRLDTKTLEGKKKQSRREGKQVSKRGQDDY